jgi:hypothetical protein
MSVREFSDDDPFSGAWLPNEGGHDLVSLGSPANGTADEIAEIVRCRTCGREYGIPLLWLFKGDLSKPPPGWREFVEADCVPEVK